MPARRFVCVLWGACIAIGLAARPATAQSAGEVPPPGPATVTVASGRAFWGEVDPQTDESRLWLRWSHGSISILRPIQWGRVVRAEFAEETFSADQLRRTMVRPADPAPEAHEPGVGRRRIIRVHAGSRDDLGLVDRTGSPPCPAEEASLGPVGRRPPRVRFLAIEASAANWDGDVEVDGLLVHVRPVDAAGELIPVEGGLEVTLIGWQTGRTRSRQPAVRLARWTRAVQPEDLGPLGIECRLPFQSVHPEYDLRWASEGTVHARLNAPGQGVFEATQSTVRIRPYSAMRDYQQYVSGGRFFPEERTGRGRR